MIIKDWKIIGNYPRGKFALEFEVTEFKEDQIRMLINRRIKELQNDLLQMQITEQSRSNQE